MSAESGHAATAFHKAASEPAALSANLPALQSEHKAAAVPEYLPVPHSPHVVAAVPANFPASQSKHVPIPISAVTLPGSQAEHGPPSGPE